MVFAVSRDYEPVPGQWYENVEEEESFRVMSVDEDSERLEIEYSMLVVNDTSPRPARRHGEGRWSDGSRG